MLLHPIHGPRIALALGALLSVPAPALPADDGAAPVATTPRFAFHSDLATNLNDALIVAGAARNDGEPELFRSGAEESCFAELPPSARLGWDLALEFYSEVVSPGGWSGRPQSLLRLDLAGLGGEPDARARRFIGITRGFLAAATPAYEACRWPGQDAENRRWIEDLTPRLEAHGPAVARRLERFYGTPLHGLPIRVDVVATAPPVGANSITRPPHILASSSIAEDDALEIVFHEASHTLMKRDDPIQQALVEAAAALDVEPPRDLWHVVLFYTTGEAVRRTLEEAGEPSYTPYLYSYERFGTGEWGRNRDAVEAAWPAYLDGERTLSEAASDLLQAVAEPDGVVESGPEPAPPLDLEVSLTGPPPESLSWEALRGRAAVIEFWATWCAPCVAAIPHWNELVEAFAGEPIVFLSVSDEDEDRVRSFLEKRPIGGAVVLDTDRDTFEAYGVKGIPHTVLVDAEGRVRAVTRPEVLEVAHLRSLLAGETPEVAPQEDFDAMLRERLGEGDMGEPLVRAMVRPASSDRGLMTAGSGRWIALGFTPLAPIAHAYGFPTTRVIADDETKRYRYDFIFSGIEDEDLRKAVMRDLIAEALDIDVRREAREREVWLLKRLPGSELGLVVSDGYGGGGRWNDGEIELLATDLAGLARALEFALRRPVLDETSVPGEYDVDLQWEPGEVGSLRAALEEVGLTLEEGTREVELLVLEKRAEEAGS